MPTLLAVRAHPLTSTESNSLKLLDEFIRAYAESHPDDRIVQLPLYEVAIPEIDLDLLNAWRKLGSGAPFVHLHSAEQSKVTLFDHYTAQFIEADRIVIANPLWNLQVPTRLKAWIDTVFVAGKTFRYDESGRLVSLVGGKHIVHIQSAGGVFGSHDPASEYLRTLFGVLDVASYHQVAAEGIDHEPARADEILAAARARAAEVAAAL